MAKKIIVKELSKLRYIDFFDDNNDDMSIFELAQCVIYTNRGSLTYRQWNYGFLPEFIHDFKLLLRAIKCTKYWYISDNDFEFILRHGDLFYVQSIIENAYEYENLSGKALNYYDNLTNILYVIGTSIDDLEF